MAEWPLLTRPFAVGEPTGLPQPPLGAPRSSTLGRSAVVPALPPAGQLLHAGVRGDLGPVSEVKLVEDVVDVVLHRSD